MSNTNICLFSPLYPTPDVIQTINFVLETKSQRFEKLTMITVYRVHFILKGNGVLHLAGSSRQLVPGDLFFIHPSVQYAIETIDNLQYIYISYIGIRASQIMERSGVTHNNFFFSGLNELSEPWKQAITNANQEITDLISESLLLHTFSVLINKNTGFKEQNSSIKPSELVMRIKKYIEDNFTDTSLSLKKISQEFSYNPKYLSSIFKHHTKVSLFNYINIVRCQHACALMDQNFTCIKDIAYLCGFHDPLYFSRVFKQKIGLSPRDYLKSRAKQP